MWTHENRGLYERSGGRYPSDLTDDEWALIGPLIPPAKHGGRPRTVDLREVLNAVLYTLETGCQWRALPKDLPPKSTVHSYLELWEWDGTLERIHHELYLLARDLEGREASPTAGVIDHVTSRRRRICKPGSTMSFSSTCARARTTRAAISKALGTSTFMGSVSTTPRTGRSMPFCG